MNLVEFSDAFDNFISGWAPTKIVKDGEPAGTLNIDEYIILRVDGGFSTLAATTGILSVRGNVIRHPFLITANVVVRNGQPTTVRRSSELCQAVLDKFQLASFGESTLCFEGSISRVGENAKRYEQIVRVGGYRDERR